MSKIEPYAGVFWGARALTFGDFVLSSREFIQTLQNLIPSFEDLYVLGDRMSDEEPLGAGLERFEELAFARAWDPNTPKDRFTHLDPAGQPTAISTCRLGWGFDLVNERESERSHRHLVLSIRAGSFVGRANANRVFLNSYDRDSPITDPSLSGRVFRYMVDFWRADRALLTDQQFRHAVRDDSTLEQLGWLNYRADGSFERFLPPTVMREKHNGGVMFRIGDGRLLTEQDQQEVAIGLDIQAAIRASLQ